MDNLQFTLNSYFVCISDKRRQALALKLQNDVKHGEKTVRIFDYNVFEWRSTQVKSKEDIASARMEYRYVS